MAFPEAPLAQKKQRIATPESIKAYGYDKFISEVGEQEHKNYWNNVPEYRALFGDQQEKYAPKTEKPEIEPPARSNLLGGIKDLGYGIATRAIPDTLAATASIFDDPMRNDGLFDPFIEGRRKAQEGYINGEGADEIAIPGTSVTRRELRQGIASLGFSGAAMGAAFAGGAAAAPLGGVGAFAGSAAASGAAAYRMDKNSFIREYRRFLEQRDGKPISDEEFARMYPGKIADLIQEHGLHEAGWEGIANAIERGLLTKIPAAGLSAKAAKNLFNFVMTEWASEAGTQIGQTNVETKLGMRPEDEMRSYLSPKDWMTSFRETGPAVMVMAGTTHLGGQAVGALNRSKEAKQQQVREAAISDLRNQDYTVQDLEELKNDPDLLSRHTGLTTADITGLQNELRAEKERVSTNPKSPQEKQKLRETVSPAEKILLSEDEIEQGITPEEILTGTTDSKAAIEFTDAELDALIQEGEASTSAEQLITPEETVQSAITPLEAVQTQEPAQDPVQQTVPVEEQQASIEEPPSQVEEQSVPIEEASAPAQEIQQSPPQEITTGQEVQFKNKKGEIIQGTATKKDGKNWWIEQEEEKSGRKKKLRVNESMLAPVQKEKPSVDTNELPAYTVQELRARQKQISDELKQMSETMPVKELGKDKKWNELNRQLGEVSGQIAEHPEFKAPVAEESAVESQKKESKPVEVNQIPVVEKQNQESPLLFQTEPEPLSGITVGAKAIWKVKGRTGTITKINDETGMVTLKFPAGKFGNTYANINKKGLEVVGGVQDIDSKNTTTATSESPTNQAIGKNQNGNDVFQDEKGRRYYVENGFKIKIPVTVSMSRERGVEGDVKSNRQIYDEGKHNFLTADEITEIEGKDATTSTIASTPTAPVNQEIPEEGNDLSAYLHQKPVKVEEPTLTKGSKIIYRTKKGESIGTIIQQHPQNKNMWQIEKADGRITYISEKSLMGIAPEKAAQEPDTDIKPETSVQIKEPWEMTLKEFSDSVYNGQHNFNVSSGSTKIDTGIQKNIDNYNRTTDPQTKQIAKESIDKNIEKYHTSQVSRTIHKGTVPENVLAELSARQNAASEASKKNEEEKEAAAIEAQKAKAPKAKQETKPTKEENYLDQFSPENLLAEWDKQAAEIDAKEKAGTKPKAAATTQPKAADKAIETKQHLANAMEKFKQINALLGERGSFSTEKADENIYAQIKPLLQGALQDIIAAGKSAAEFVSISMQALTPKAKPYFERFVKEDMVLVLEQQSTPKETTQDDTTDNDRKPGLSENEKEDDRGSNERKSSKDVSASPEAGIASDGSESERESSDGGLQRSKTRHNNEVENKSSRQRDNVGSDSKNRDRFKSGVGRDSGKPSGVQRRGTDHRIEQGELNRSGSWKTTANNNLDAIALYKKITEENRQATPEEQKTLAKYVGWGASELANNMFPAYSQLQEVRPGWAKAGWEDSVKRLTEVMTPEEIRTAAKSTQYAHYTSEKVVRSIYRALEQMGFKGGKILEPGMGVGNFIGLLPENMRKSSSYTGIEMDHITAGIAKLLYPNQNILQADFTKQTLPKNFFDAAIGNPPFGGIKILSDPEYARNSFSLHNYFFAKSIDRVRPGGLLVFVTSRYSMDSLKDSARKYLSDRADLLGAIRLPQTAFKQNAGTDVVTDVLFLQKREDGAKPSGQAWTGISTVTLKDSTGQDKESRINEYFVAHPEMVLGRHALTGKMYSRDEYTVDPLDGDIEEHFAKAIEKLPKKIYSNTTVKTKTTYNVQAIIERDFNPKNKKEGGLYLSDNGTLMRVDFGSGVSVDSVKKVSDKDKAMLKDYIGLRDKLKLSHQAQLNNGDWESALKELNGEYDKFIKEHGHIQEYTTVITTEVNDDGVEEKIERRRYKKERLLNTVDTESTLVWALEKINDDGEIVKASALTDRTIMRPTVPEIKTIPDALAVSLDNLGILDIDHVAEIAGKPMQEVVDVLGNLIYKSPDNEQYVIADEYLSGDVVQKLEEAMVAAKSDSQFEKNVEALKAVQPEPLTSSDISVLIGGTWIPENHYNDFARDELGIKNASVSYDRRLGLWSIEGQFSPQGLRSASDEWGTVKRGKNEILDSVMNNRSIRITTTVEDVNGKKQIVVDQEATTAANEVAKKMRERFSSWVWQDLDRANELLDIYNKRFNNLAPRKFNGSHLTLPGVSLKLKLYSHQKDAIWRIIQSGNTYLNHAVGAGKTFTMIAAGMEMRRLGMVSKPMYVVPNHMLGQFAQEFQELYPMANIMVADEQNFHTDNRRRFVSQATLNNPDAIVMTHSSFGLIKSKEENITPVREEFIDDMRYALETMKDEDAPKMKIKKMEKMIEQAEQRFDSLIGSGDNVVSFEDMGVDFMFVDEAHEFRKLDFTTNRQVKGIDVKGSKKAIDLYIKTLWVEQMNKGRSHVFASGTPIVNTIGEMYSIMRFFDRTGLIKDGLEHFDSWASMFGEAASDYEMNSAGRYEIVERFSKFVNIPEMMSRVRQFTDVLTNKQLGTRVQRPDIKGGTPEIVLAPKTEELTQYQNAVLQPRIEKSKNWKPSKEQPGNPDPIINIITDGRLASIDMRFVDPDAKNNPSSKLNKYIDGIIETYKTTKNNEYLIPGTDTKSPVKGGTQICFYNVGFGKNVAATRGFNAREWAMKRFKSAGISGNHIAWIDDYETAVRKQALFKQVREGKKRILLGSARKMGTGVNAQTRLTDLHYLDAPWFTADVEQPDGRIIRQGNQNFEVSIKRYATEGSYDSTMWQMVARKSQFIEQAWFGDKGVRTIEDVSETSQYAMASALASGDQRVIQLVGLQADVSRLERLKGAHRQNQHRLVRDRRENEDILEEYKEKLAALKEAQKTFPKYVNQLDATINGKKFDKKHEFNLALKDAVKKAVINTATGAYKLGVKDKPITVADVNGAKIVVMLGESYQHGYAMLLNLKLTDQMQPNFSGYVKAAQFDEFFDGSNIAVKALNIINKIPSEISTKENDIKRRTEDAGRIKKRLGAPFEYERELKEKFTELRRLEDELAAEGQEVSESAPAEKRNDVQYSTTTTPDNKFIATLTGNEIKGEDGNAVFESARQYFRENLQGTNVEREGLGAVYIGRTGWRKTKRGLKTDFLKARLIPAIPDIIKNGEISDRQPAGPDRKDRIVAFYHISGNVKLGESLYQAGITIGEDPNGNLFYNINHDTDKLFEKKKARGLSRIEAPGHEPSSENLEFSKKARLLPRKLAEGGKPSSENQEFSVNNLIPDTDGVNLFLENVVDPGKEINLASLQAYFAAKKQTTGINSDGSLWVRLQNGTGFNVELVERFSPDEYRMAISSGAMDETGHIAGQITRNNIKLATDFATKHTIDHEMVHFMENSGILNRSDTMVLDGQIRKFNRLGKLIFSPVQDAMENRANFLAQVLANREQYRGTALGRVLQKIADFIDSLIYIGRQSTRKIARGMETGKIFAVTPTAKPQAIIIKGQSIWGVPGTKQHEIQAWHGSPHIIEGGFSDERIGSGEGIAAFGSGHYQTNAREIAEKYAKMGKDRKAVKGEMLPITLASHPKLNSVKNRIESLIEDMQNGIKAEDLEAQKAELEDIFDNKWTQTPAPVVKEIEKLEEFYNRNLKESGSLEKSAGGNLYNTTIHKGKSPSQYDYMSWYEPLTEAQMKKITDKGVKGIPPDTPVSTVYNKISKRLGSPKAATQFFLKAGIDGIEFPAGTLSQWKGKQAVNYVVFDPREITINERIQYSTTKPAGYQSDAFKSILPEEVAKQMEINRGVRKKSMMEKISEVAKQLKHERHHFPELMKDAATPSRSVNQEILRGQQDVGQIAQDRAKREITNFIRGLDREGMDMYALNIILADEVRMINDGLREDGKLPNGFKTTREVLETYKKLQEQTKKNASVTRALELRKRYQQTIAKDLVEYGIMPKQILQSDDYFHHQVLKYFNEKRQGIAAGSPEVRNKWRGWMKGRISNAEEYNTEYLEAEFMVLAQQIAQVETAKNLVELEKENNLMSDLKQQATQVNIKAIKALAPDPLTDLLQPFKKKIAMGFSRIGQLIRNDKLTYDQEYEGVVRAIKNSQGIAMNHPRLFEFLSHQIERGQTGAGAAAMIYKGIKERDKFIKTTLGDRFKTYKDMIPEGYKEWEPKPDNAWFWTNSIGDQVLQDVLAGTKSLEDKDVRKILARGKDITWVIPEGLANQMDKLRPVTEHTMLEKTSAKILGAWKQWILINPLSVFKYNFNNMSGDLDAVLAYNPKITLGMKQALVDIKKWAGHQDISANLKKELTEAQKLGAVGSGFAVQEVDDVMKMMNTDQIVREVMMGEKPGIAAKIWQTSKKWTSIREDVLRLAAYRWFKDQIENKGKTKLYGASNPKDIDNLIAKGRTAEASAKLARELLGDYGNISATGETIRRRMIPFYAWMEINLPRYVRLMRNLKEEGSSVKGLSFVVAKRAAVFAAKASMLAGAIMLWNMTARPDEDDDMGESGRKQLHFIWGRRKDGSIISIRFQGALTDALSWFGAEDLPSDLADLVKGKATIQDKLIDIPKAILNKGVNSLRPEPKLLYESITGQSAYPDALSPRPIRDKVENALKTFKMDSFYRYAIGRPGRGDTVAQHFISDLADMFTYTTEPGVQAYYDTRKLVMDWKKENGLESGGGTPTKKGNAMYYYKQALKYGDLPAAKRYLEKYYDLGGTNKGANQSIKMAHPIAGIRKQDRYRFRQSLSPAEVDRLQKGLDWYKRTYL